MDERNERMLLKIAALLVALALLAERAAGRSFPVRFLVLAILGRAEVIARAFLAEATPPGWPCLDEAPAMSGSPADAASLALRLRLLAALLYHLAFAARSARHDAGAAAAPRPSLTLLVILPAARPHPRPHDTS